MPRRVAGELRPARPVKILADTKSEPGRGRDAGAYFDRAENGAAFLRFFRMANRLDRVAELHTEGEGLEPPSACARRFSRPLPYQLGLSLQGQRKLFDADPLLNYDYELPITHSATVVMAERLTRL